MYFENYIHMDYNRNNLYFENIHVIHVFILNFERQLDSCILEMDFVSKICIDYSREGFILITLYVTHVCRMVFQKESKQCGNATDYSLVQFSSYETSKRITLRAIRRVRN